MRRFLMFLTVLVLSVVAGGRDVSAAGGCDMTNCGYKCIVWGDFGGYCNPPAEPTTGCIQFYGPDCASMQNAACCKSEGGGSF